MNGRLRDQGPTLLVATLAAAFGVALLQVTGILAAVLAEDDVTGSSGTVRLMLGIVASVFITIAVYVSAVVTANTVATIVAGRTRQIALLRLIGSSARSQRAAIAREGLVIGALGAALGAVVGSASAWVLGEVGVAQGVIPSVERSLLDPVVLLPMGAVVLTTWLAAWTGSRRVLAVRPVQALGNSAEADLDEVSSRVGRTVAAWVFVILGALLLVLGVLVGLVRPEGVLIGLVGGILSFTGIVLAAHRVMPPVLRAVGSLFGGRPAARLAAENAVRHPERSARMTIGIVIGVTLVTTFAVTMESYRTMLTTAFADEPALQSEIGPMVDGTVAVFSALIGFSAVIAAVGLVNTLSISIMQRTRELGLLRALGFDRRQIRAMVLVEAAALTVAATATGLVLGVVYGWAGAQSMLGSVGGAPAIVAPAIPWLIVAIVVVAAALLTLAASVAPMRRAARVSPVVALAVE
ncbi:FtsX-like permease family protein [Agromyces sp. SYSU K20354]|uniref:ABC transporter permease n=1 Tax=Agromyces cavernae TaxID=2898659 RepID=UPI001E40E363|nr:ABC transporter permease [Agromyces cavernae]MCD2441982.1 FtsX-like permease family protein [Agromyces cavernae]